MKIRLFLCAAAAGLSLIAAGCRRGSPAEQPDLPAATVRLQTVERKSRPATEETVGTVRARLRAVIEAKISGRIDKLTVVPGQNVTSGELLAELDAREVRARRDQAAATLQQAEADLQRANTLMAQKILSQSEFDSIQSKYRVASAAATEAETMLAYATITAPFDGVITRKHADVGDLATPGKPLLEMEDSRDLRLEADVPEAVVGNLKLGDKLPVRISAVTNEIIGTISEISPAADPNSRTFLVKLDLPATAGLRAGQFGRAAMPVGETSALRVPASAVVQRGQMEFVFVASNSHAQMRIVKTGKRIGDEVEIVAGLDAGEKVITEGAGNLVDGQPVVAK